jgi:hypothetical protein
MTQLGRRFFSLRRRIGQPSMTNKCHELCVAFKRMTANPVKNPSLRIGQDRESNAAFGRIFDSGDLSQSPISPAWLRDTLEKLPTCLNSQIDSLLPLRSEPLLQVTS